MEILDIKIQAEIINSVIKVIENRGWGNRGYDGDDEYNPFFCWEENHYKFNYRMHHTNYHPEFGFIIYRGHFYHKTGYNNKNINTIDLMNQWKMNEIKYDEYLLKWIEPVIRKIMDKYNIPLITICFSFEEYKKVSDMTIARYNLITR